MSTTNSDYILPEGWQIDPSFAETVGPKIKKKDHLSGNQDKSKMLEEEIGDDMDGADMSEEEYSFWAEKCGCDHKDDEEEDEEFAEDGKNIPTLTLIRKVKSAK